MFQRHPMKVLTLLAVLVAAISPGGPILAQEQEEAAVPAARPAAPPMEYRIGKEDVLRVNVFGEETLSLDAVPVRPDGRISVPLLGDIQAEGLTPQELAMNLQAGYTDHVLAPVVTVILMQIKSFKVYVLGNIKQPGVIELGQETRLLQVLAQARGFTEFANTKRILVLREEGETTRRLVINYDRIVSGEELEGNVKLKPGDTVVVP